MLLLVGLGNPSPENENNRHNIGFKIINAINKKFGLTKQKPKFKGLLTTRNIGNKKVYAIKPLTFMNLSGSVVLETLNFYKIKNSNLYVIHDDLDLKTAKIKIKIGGGNGGHNGLESIDNYIGNKYHRIRIGIDHPGNKDLVSSYVLNKFSKIQKILIDNNIDEQDIKIKKKNQ